MVTVLKQGSTKENIQLLLKKLDKKPNIRGLDAYKYCGRIGLIEDSLGIQKRMRNEWE
jgi:hypothetical protein